MNCIFKYRRLLKIILSLLLFLLSYLFIDSIIYIFILILSYFIVAFDIYREAFEAFTKKDFFNECSLMILATIGAFYIGEYPEAVMVILLFEIGEYLSEMAISKSKDSIVKLMDLRCDKTNIKSNGEIISVSSYDVDINDVFIVKPGESVPIDGILISNGGLLDTSSITGESIPKMIRKGDKILSGTISKDSILEIMATSTYKNSTAFKIIELMEQSDNNKTKAEKLMTRFSHIYTPLIVSISLLIILIPTMLGLNFNTYLYKSLIFLVTSCPCALVISIPLSFFAGIGRASKEGILFKGSNELESFNNIKCIAFDKTGTITEGNFSVSEIKSVDKNVDIMKIAAYLEYYSLHPIASSIKDEYHGDINPNIISSYKELVGKGVSAKVDGTLYYAGNNVLMDSLNIKYDNVNSIGTVIYIARENSYMGYIVISDNLKKDVKELANYLDDNSIKTVIISGDNDKCVKKVSDLIGITDYYSELLPIDKVNIVNKLQQNSFVAVVGDGLNDAPVLKKANIGISMGTIGVDASLEASDVVLMHDKLMDIKKAKIISSLTLRTIKLNITFAILFKVLLLILGLIGITSIWGAVIADVGVCLATILNSLNLLRKKLY